MHRFDGQNGISINLTRNKIRTLQPFCAAGENGYFPELRRKHGQHFVVFADIDLAQHDPVYVYDFL